MENVNEIFCRSVVKAVAAWCIAVCGQSACADISYNAVWNVYAGSCQTNWNLDVNWENGYIGGGNASDNIDFAFPFASKEPALRYGQVIDAGKGVNFSPVFHSITGLPIQVIARTGEPRGSITVTDPSGFCGIWAQSGFSNSYIVNPEEGVTPVFQRVANGQYPAFTVAQGGSVYIRDLLGRGSIVLNGEGEVILNSPRSLNSRVVMKEGGTLTVKSEVSAADAPAEGAMWRFDAAKPESMRMHYDAASGRTYVTNWLDADGGVAMAYVPNEDFRPFLSTETVNGHRLVDFGGYIDSSSNCVPVNSQSLYGPSGYMYVGKTNSLSANWNNVNNIREAFMVVKAHAMTQLNFAAPLGHHSSYYLCMTFSKNQMYHAQYSVLGHTSGGYVSNYRAWLDGEPYVGYGQYENALNRIAAWDPTELHVIALNFNEGSIPRITALGSTRGYKGKECGGFMLAEAMIYTNLLTDAERRQTVDYLKRKWMSGADSKPYDLDAVVVADEGAVINVEAGDSAKIRTVRLAANMDDTAKIVKTGDGTLEVEHLAPASAGIEVKGGRLILSRDSSDVSSSSDGVPAKGLLYWLDATSGSDKFETGENGVVKWYDRRDGYSGVFASSVNKNGTAMPALVEDSVSGKTVMNFGNAVSDEMPYATITVDGSTVNIKEAFVVWKRNGNVIPGILLDGGRNGGLRHGNERIVYDGWTYAAIAGMLWTVDGMPIETTSSTVGDFKNVGNGSLSVINFTSQSELKYYYLALTGWLSNGTGGGCAIGEVIAYNRQLTDDERRNVTAYLMNKWQNGAVHPMASSEAIADVTFTDTPIDVGASADRTISTLSGSGAMTKSGAGRLAVGTLNGAVTSITVSEGTLAVNTALAETLAAADVASGTALELTGSAGVSSLSGEGTLKCGTLTSLNALSATARADGTFSCFVVDGALESPVGLTVNLDVEDGFDGDGAYRILAADSVTGSRSRNGWTMNVSGTSTKQFSLLLRDDGIYVRVSGPGFFINIR